MRNRLRVSIAEFGSAPARADDVDAAFQRAIEAGTIPKIPVANAFYGDRYGQLTDPFGHVWALATVLEKLTPEQVDERAMEHFGQMQGSR